MHAKSMQRPVADKGADDADGSVADETKSVAPYNFSGQPSDNQADNQDDDQGLVRHTHRFPALALLICSVHSRKIPPRQQMPEPHLTETRTDGAHARPARRIGALLIGAFVCLSASPAFAAEVTAETDKSLATLCGIVDIAARQEGLPVDIFTRLIWRESAFQSGAVSPAGAEGVAQFMPRTASERGLVDPFDPAAAIPASAKFLAALSQRFGNLGLAAAAYNARPSALAEWLAGKGSLPPETQNYVLSVTGHAVEEWRGRNLPAPNPEKPCLASIGNLGTQVQASVSQRSALRPAAGALHGNYNAIGHMQLLRLAADANMAPRAYVLFALKVRGIGAKDDDLLVPRNGWAK